MEECREAKGKEVRKEGRWCVTREKRSEGGDEGGGRRDERRRSVGLEGQIMEQLISW